MQRENHPSRETATAQKQSRQAASKWSATIEQMPTCELTQSHKLGTQLNIARQWIWNR
jgi:hypothetical protein